MQNTPWWRGTRRWGQTNMTEDDPVRLDIAFWREHWRRTGIQGVIVNASGIVSYYPSASPLQYRAKTLGEGDLFGAFSAAARQEGLAVVARMDVNRCTEDFYNAHPDWFCVDREGRPITSQGRYFSCVNGGYYEQFIPDTLREIIALYHPDGFTDNSWSGMGRKAICYCGNCKEKFQAATGLELPPRADWDAPGYPEWVRWSMERRTEIWDLFNDVTQRAGGPDCLWSGMLHADPSHGCDSLRDLEALCNRAKIIFTDHQSRDMLNGFEQNSLNGALLRMASQDENTLVPESIAHYVRGERAFRLAAAPAGESRMWLLDGIAGGISPWYHHIGGSTRDRRQFDTTADIFTWHGQNEDALYDRVDLARVGLVWDQINAAFYGRERRLQRVAQPWRGFHHALVKERIPFLPVNAKHISRDCRRLNALILPNLAILSQEARRAVGAHLAAGGGLVLSGPVDTLDDRGLPRPGGLLEELGLHLDGQTLGEDSGGSPSWEDFATHNYFLLPEGDRHPVLDGFDKTRIVPLGGCVLGAASRGSLKAVAGYVPSFPIYPPEFSYIREERPDVGAIFAGTLASGARVVWFAADTARACGAFLLPDHARLLANAIRWAAKEEMPISVQGTGTFDCRVYRQGERIIAHLVNLSGLDTRGYVEEPLPALDITVRISCPNWKSARAHLRVGDRVLSVPVEGGVATLDIGRIDEHQLIVLQEG